MTATLYSIAPEIRQAIFAQVFRAIIVKVERGEEIPAPPESEPEGSPPVFTPEENGTQDQSAAPSTAETDDDDAESEWIPMYRPLTPLPKIPDQILSLRSVCRHFNEEIDDSWHSYVTYQFPSTVAMLDVVSQWSHRQVQAVKYISVLGSPLPIYPYDNPNCYTTFNIDNAIALLSGMNLHILTVENIWLAASGEPEDGWCLGATYHELEGFLSTTGWKRLEYVSGILGLIPSEQRKLIEQFEALKTRRNEPDMTLWLAESRPQLSHIISYPVDGTQTSQDSAADVEEVIAWYKAHPGDDEKSYPEVTEKKVTMVVTRGEQAKTIQDGSDIHRTLQGLRDNIGWVRLRQTNQFLVDDGLDNASAHL